jgi:hypothetical protein
VAQAVEIEVNHRRGVKGQDLAEDQAADDGQAQRLAHFRAFGTAEQQRQGAEDGRQGGHQDRPQAQQAGAADRLQRRQAVVALQLQARSIIRMAFFFTTPISRNSPAARSG